MSSFERANTVLQLCSNYELHGKVTNVTGIIIEGNGPLLPVGSEVEIVSGSQTVLAQVVGFRGDTVLLMPFSETQGVLPGALIKASRTSSEILVSEDMCGKILDPFGMPIDGGPALEHGVPADLFRAPPNPITRTRISNCLDLGVRAINSLLTIGEGQRVGIMSGSGVGKSTLLGMIAKHSQSDINVIGLVGERGREVREFLERDLGEEGMKRSVVVVATGDKSPLLRVRAAFFATAIAEYFRDLGKRVVLMVDSITRLAMAQREIGLAVGEAPSTKGYTPSVFSILPRLLERPGTSPGAGSITALYTVLVEGDDFNEPIADATRGILDGHIVLSRELASRGHFPAIDVLGSVSRVMSDIVSEEVLDNASAARSILATYRDNEDLLTIGAYKEGQNPRVDRAVKLYPQVERFLRQKPQEKSSIQESWDTLSEILEEESE